MGKSLKQKRALIHDEAYFPKYLFSRPLKTLLLVDQLIPVRSKFVREWFQQGMQITPAKVVAFNAERYLIDQKPKEQA